MRGMRAVSFTSWYSLTVPLFVSGVFGLVLYVTDDVMSSIGMRLLNLQKKKIRKVLTRIQIRRDHVEHVGVHVSVYDPIAGCVISGSNKDRISLSHRDTY